MSIIGSNILAGASGQAGYNLNNSLRFRGSNSAYLSRTPASATNRTTWTWSAWVKRGSIGATSQVLFSAGSALSINVVQLFFSSDKLSFQIYDTGTVGLLESTALYRDPAAWYHVVAVMNTTNATSANRMQLYVNGNQITSFGTATYPSQNFNAFVNTVTDHSIGNLLFGTRTNQLDAYLADVNFIDGQALTPSSFGETSLTTGQWIPKAYSGSYGTNGFKLNFSDTSAATAAAIGKDSSGNGNNWTPSGISVTAGTTYDAMTDVPTNTSATVANYAVWNPLSPTGATCADGNLQATITTSGKWTVGTFAVSSGKYYFECVLGGSTPELAIGIAPNSGTTVSSNALHYYSLDGKVYSSNSVVATGATFTSGDIIGVAFEPSGNAYFYKNNTLQATVSMPAGSDWCAETYQTGSRSNTATVNFGQRPFSYTPPSGYVALNTYNLPTPTILQGNKYMDATTYTGTGTALNVVNQGQFKPDFVWVKDRGVAQQHLIYDSIRGVYNFIGSSSTAAESTNNQTLTSFNSNGFGLGTNGTSNSSAGSFVGWQWQAGQGSTSSNTSGSITSTVSVNTTAGFSVVTFNTGASGGKTIGHGLGVKPAMLIFKDRSNANNWLVWHQSYSNQAQGHQVLNGTQAVINDATIWNNTAPTSTVASITSGYGFGTSANVVMYAWAEIAGFSKFTSYTGNGSADGVFVYLGFRPKWVMLKNTGAVGHWYVLDTARNTYNVMDTVLLPSASNADTTITSIDCLSNGFKLRTTSSDINGSGTVYIVAAFAENPFKTSNAR